MTFHRVLCVHFPHQLLIDGILGTLVIFLVLELLICITAMLFGLSVLAAGGNQVSNSSTSEWQKWRGGLIHSSYN